MHCTWFNEKKKSSFPPYIFLGVFFSLLTRPHISCRPRLPLTTTLRKGAAPHPRAHPNGTSRWLQPLEPRPSSLQSRLRVPSSAPHPPTQASPRARLHRECSPLDPSPHDKGHLKRRKEQARINWGFPGGSGGKESACQCRRCRFDP